MTTHVEEIEAKLASNQEALTAAQKELADAEASADAALLEGGPDALLAAQSGLQQLRDRVTALERYAGVLEGQRQAAKVADAKPQMAELVEEARQQVKAEESAYRKAITAADAAAKAIAALNERCSETSATLARIRGLASGAGLPENAGGAVPRPGGLEMQMNIEREISITLMTAGQTVALVRHSCSGRGID